MLERFDQRASYIIVHEGHEPSGKCTKHPTTTDAMPSLWDWVKTAIYKVCGANTIPADSQHPTLYAKVPLYIAVEA